jgi:hypothetical protein
MNNMKKHLFAALFTAATLVSHYGQAFDTGSNGSMGALEVVDANVTVDLPPDGRLHYTSVTVNAGRTLTFKRNALNTPVYLLSQGDIVVSGLIDVSGSAAPGSPPIGGAGGPGGFDGGKPGFGPESAPGDGYGPGAGGGGTTGFGAESAGGGGYGSPGAIAIPPGSARRGGTYGSPLLIPLIGGSGAGGDTGTPGRGGAGGGGAILLASNTKIRLLAGSSLHALGGSWAGRAGTAGSGGAVRLLAPRIEGSGTVNVSGGSAGGGDGRIRVDCIDKTGLQLTFAPLANTTVGANMFVDPGILPRLDITAAAGQAIPVGTGSTVRIQLPFGSDTNRTVTLQAKDFGVDVPIRVTLTPDSGPRIEIDTNIVNTANNPATLTIPVGLPVNTVVTIQAWTR